ncbi:uncharacterized protein VTP21DRAFT_7548 [Calcarisporiella thermophila]|uniref:uncharacterized protein n=1 Tax=Calcarisporiella thermophila TaxID=911321 RepID=UPI0037449D0F
MESGDAIDRLCTKLQVSPIFFSEEHPTPFRESALETFKQLRSGLPDLIPINEGQERQEKIGKIIASCAGYWKGDKWSSKEIVLVVNDILERLRELLNYDSINSLFGFYLAQILQHHIRPYFTQSHPAMEKKRNRYVEKNKMDLYEKQPWKTDRVETVSIMETCVLAAKQFDVESAFFLLIPPLLTLIDDYDIQYKILGVRMFSHVLSNVSASKLTASGLDGVFYEALLSCLSYRNDPSFDILIQHTFSALFRLVILTNPPDTERYFLQMDQLFAMTLDGLRMSGDKPAYRAIYLEQIPLLIEKLGMVSIKYLKVVLEILLDTAQVPFVGADSMKRQVLRLHEICVKALDTAIKMGWPRIPVYRGLVLRIVAESWSRIEEFEHENAQDALSIQYQDGMGNLKKNFCDIVSLLHAVCGETIKADLTALRELDQNMFSPLVSSVLAPE